MTPKTSKKPKSPQLPDKKLEKFEAVSLALFHLLATQPLAKITHANVARRAGVSRAWLYKYLGADKDDLIRFAIEHLGRKLTERDSADVIRTKADFVDAIVLGVERMFENTREFPWFVPVYFKYKGTSTTPAKAIHEIEQTYVQRQAATMKRIFKSQTSNQSMIAAEILTTMRMGLAFNWQHGEISKLGSQANFLMSVRHWVTELFGN
jgi:AcrR family transcriptional regulator